MEIPARIALQPSRLVPNRNPINVANASKNTKPKKTVQTGNPASKSRRRKSLSLLLDMPLDVLFEVLGHLAPKDLINVSRTNKGLRAMLLERSATSIWKSSRLRMGDNPSPPKGMPECQWVALILTSDCTSCGTHNVQRIDFLLRRRICKKCKEQNVVSDIKQNYPDLHPIVSKLVCPDFFRDFYWRPDIDRLVKIVEGYQSRIRDGDQKAESELAAFEEKRKERLEEMRKEAKIFTDWHTKLTDQEKKAKNDANKQQKIKMCKERFHALGYTDADMPNLHLESALTNHRGMSEKSWGHFRKRMEWRYFQNKHNRLNREDLLIRRERRQMAVRAYNAYVTTVNPHMWKYLPPTETVCGMQPFRDLIAASRDVDVDQAAFDQARTTLPKHFLAAADERTARIVDILVQSQGIVAQEDDPNAKFNQAFATLELVRISYHCLHCRSGTLWGLEEISSHFCETDFGTAATFDAAALDQFKVGQFGAVNSPPCFQEGFYDRVSYNGARLLISAQSLAQFSGLSGESVTVGQMDALDLRYTCILCKEEPVAYTWRGCTMHLENKHSTVGSRPKAFADMNLLMSNDIIAILSPADADFVKAQEHALERGAESKWACMLCPAHFECSIPYADVMEHVKETHDIENPQENVDLMLFRRARKDHAIPYVPAPLSGEYKV